MKKLIPIFIFAVLILSNCKEGGLLPAKKRKIYGNWEMVSYEINNKEVIYSRKFVNLGMSMGKGNYSDPTVFTHRNLSSQEIRLSGIPNYAQYHEEVFNLGLIFDKISYVDTLDFIDPWFYRASNAINADTLGNWDIKKLNKRILILKNTSYQGVNDIKMIFEKTKSN